VGTNPSAASGTKTGDGRPAPRALPPCSLDYYPAIIPQPIISGIGTKAINPNRHAAGGPDYTARLRSQSVSVTNSSELILQFTLNQNNLCRQALSNNGLNS
jgi:hypothetical protein